MHTEERGNLGREHPFNLNPLVIAEEQAAVRDAEERLADVFTGWPSLSFRARPVALKLVLMDAVTLFLAEPVRAETWLNGLAKMMDVPNLDLRRLIQRRADILSNIRELWPRNRAEVEREVASWIF